MKEINKLWKKENVFVKEALNCFCTEGSVYCAVKMLVYCLMWLPRSFVKSDKVTLIVSWGCDQGYLRLGLETKVYNTKLVLQTGGVGLKTGD